MPRTYKPSNKTYRKYESSEINDAISEYKNSNRSLAEISKKYNIPKSVLHRHNTRFMKKQGGQTVLSQDAEEYIVECLNHCSEWGYPLDTYDLRVLVKGYLDRAGIDAKRFKKNMPGPDFVNSFLRRYKNKISLRISQNIKRSRAAVSPEIINEYFDELEKTLEGVPLKNIINYDETNLSDDPGRRKVITKRGAKYPERIMNHSKASTSIMMAASADGSLLPCYVVYKAKNVYDSWTKNGPKRCLYGCSISGWFDSLVFEDWVRRIVIPYFENKQGKKILIGDNLSSHLSLELIKECRELNIHFVFLPANSTHLTQPLDVAFFRPAKGAWRDILLHWKKTDGRNLATTPKSIFPSLLKDLLKRIECRTESNILAGFNKAGIHPLNRQRVLERLPNDSLDEKQFNKNDVNETLLSMLKEMRYGTGTKKVSNKRKKLNVKPGQSVCADSEPETSNKESDGSDLDEADNLPPNKKIKIAKLVPEEKKRECEEKFSFKKAELRTYRKKGKIEKNKDVKTSEQSSLKELRKEDKSDLNKTDMLPLSQNKKIKIAKLVPEEKKSECEEKFIFKKPKPRTNTKKGKSGLEPETQPKKILPKETEEIEFDINNYPQSMLDDNALDIEKMPFFFDDDLMYQHEIEIGINRTQENKEISEKENIEIVKKEHVDKKNNKDPVKNIKILSVERFENKQILIDVKKNKEISLNDAVCLANKSNKGKGRNFYKNDLDILRDLMDDDLQ